MSTDFATFIAQLQQDLAQPLPGRDAQWAMAPRPRPGAGRYDEPGTDARQGGVLILFYPRAGDVWLPLILRPTYRGVHSGQVGLPGGGYETIDTDITSRRCRERRRTRRWLSSLARRPRSALTRWPSSRRSVSSWVSPGPRKPIPPFCRSR